MARDRRASLSGDKGGTADAPTTYEGPHIDIYFESAGDQVTVDVSPR